MIKVKIIFLIIIFNLIYIVVSVSIMLSFKYERFLIHNYLNAAELQDGLNNYFKLEKLKFLLNK